MSWTAVARKDFQNARLSRSLWLLTGLFVLFAAGMAWVYTEIEALGAGDPQVTALGLYDFLASSATLFVSIAALVLAYKAVAGERDSGSVKLLLGLPHSRLDVVLGKVVGRTATLAVSIVLGFVVALGVIVTLYDAYSLVDYALFVGVTLLFALVYVSLMVGISASVSTSGKAAALAFGTFVVVELLWGAVATAAVYVANGFALPATMAQYPTWYFGIVSLSPSAAYQSALATVLDGASTTGEVIGGTAEAVYLEPWFGFVWLTLWLLVPLAVGAFRFSRADL